MIQLPTDRARGVGTRNSAPSLIARTVRFHAVTDEELIALAESVDRVVAHQVGANTIPRSEISRVVSPLESLAWLQRGLVTEHSQLRERLAVQIGERRARLRLKTGRHILAAVAAITEGSDARKTLLLAFIRQPKETFDLILVA